MHNKVRRGATVLGDGSAEFVLWVPSYGDVEVERVVVRAEGLRESALAAARGADGHWDVGAFER